MWALAPGGSLFVIETDPERDEFGRLARRYYPEAFSPERRSQVLAFFRSHGFERHTVDTLFRAPDREALAAVLRMDYGDRAAEVLRQVAGLGISYSMTVFHYGKAHSSDASAGPSR